jgi:shikimate 5-dehydrogenase
MRYAPASKPTFYFIGVTTGKSSIRKVFPAWAAFLGLGDAALEGMDFRLHDDPSAYREAVAFLRDDPLSLGALVTTHKIDLFDACRDLFDEVDEFAELMGETSCISKKRDKLVCHAKDPISSGLTVDAMLGADHFAHRPADVFVMGAGGSAIAITWHLMRQSRGSNVPVRIIVSDRSQVRLNEIRRVHERIPSHVPVTYALVADQADTDRIMANLADGSLVINASGLGKDIPGSPISDGARFPLGGIAWDLNYRGDLVFLQQARRAAVSRSLTVFDGWTYFLHGWGQVIAEVFHIQVPSAGPTFDKLSQIAIEASGRP